MKVTINIPKLNIKCNAFAIDITIGFSFQKWVLHQMWWVYNLKNYFKLQLLEFLLLGGQSIIGLGCLLFFSFVQAENHHYTCFKVVEISVTKRNSLD